MIQENGSKRFSIGMKVLSIDFGIGIVTAIEKLQEDGIDFYVIEYGKNKSKNYFPVDGNNKVRSVSSKTEFEEALQTLSFSRCVMKFESKKERQIYFNREIEQNELKLIINRLAELISMSDLTPKEQKIVDLLIGTLELEASIILKISKEKSNKFISKFVA